MYLEERMDEMEGTIDKLTNIVDELSRKLEKVNVGHKNIKLDNAKNTEEDLNNIIPKVQATSDQIVSLQYVMSTFGVTRSTVTRWIEKGSLVQIKIPYTNKVYITGRSVNSLILGEKII